MADGTRYSAEEIYGFARDAGFSPDQAATMTAVALAESGGNSGAHNPSGEDSRGLWQINVRAHGHLGDADLYDPRANAAAAFEVSRRGADISPWTVTHGNADASYLRYRDEARAAAEAAGDGPGLGVWEGVDGYGDRTPAGDAEPTGGDVGEQRVADPDPEPADGPGDGPEDGPENGPEDNEALHTFLESALAQAGDTYRFGAETDLDDSDPDAFDCSELVQWAAHQAGTTVPDGAIYQYRHLTNEGTTMSVEEALHTPGALLFRFSQDPSAPGRPASAHVAISLGDGRTIEARGSKYGVGSWEASETRFQYAGYVPSFGAEPLVDEPVLTPETAPEQAPSITTPATPGPPTDPVLEDLRELEETYNIAAQVLHDESVEALETKDKPELTDAVYEKGGLMAQLKAVPGHRSGYEERRDTHQEQADALNAEYTRLEAEGRFEEAEEKLEEALQEDARARLDQRRIEELDRREDALTERVEQLEGKIAELTGLEERDSTAIAELEKNADTLDDARRSVLDAIALREEAAQLRLQAEQARAAGDTARAEELDGQAAARVYASDVHRERALETVPDNETVRGALEEAEELNRVSVVLVGEQEIEEAGATEPLLPDAMLHAMRAEYDRAGEALHFEALQELRAGGEIQALEQHALYDRAQGLGAELEHVRGQLVQDAKMVEARRGQAEKLREEAAELRSQGDERGAEEKAEQADRVDVLREMVERSIEWRTSREAQLSQEHGEALDAATAARKSALEHAGRESELEASADVLDDATRVLDEAVAARAEAHRLSAAANQARSAGDQQRAEELKEQSVQQMTRSNALTQQAATMVSGDVAAAAEAHGDDAAWSFEILGDGADQAGADALSTDPLGINPEGIDPEGQAPLPGEATPPEEEDLLGEISVSDRGVTVEGLDPVVPLPREPEEELEPAFHEQSRFDDDLEAEPEPEPHPEPDLESAFFADHATAVKGAEPVPAVDESADSFE